MRTYTTTYSLFAVLFLGLGGAWAAFGAGNAVDPACAVCCLGSCETCCQDGDCKTCCTPAKADCKTCCKDAADCKTCCRDGGCKDCCTPAKAAAPAGDCCKPVEGKAAPACCGTEASECRS